MKNLTKLFSIFAIAVMMTLTLCLVVGCVEDPDQNQQWDGRTYVVYLYLEDGTTPVKGIKLSLCYNSDEAHSSCLSPKRTDAEGKVEFVLGEDVTFVGNPVIHFDGGVSGNYNLPEGYNMPTEMSAITMNGVADAYEHACELKGKVTKFNLVKAQ